MRRQPQVCGKLWIAFLLLPSASNPLTFKIRPQVGDESAFVVEVVQDEYLPLLMARLSMVFLSSVPSPAAGPPQVESERASSGDLNPQQSHSKQRLPSEASVWTSEQSGTMHCTSSEGSFDVKWRRTSEGTAELLMNGRSVSGQLVSSSGLTGAASTSFQGYIPELQAQMTIGNQGNLLVKQPSEEYRATCTKQD